MPIKWRVNLAPDLQEEILCLPRVELGPDPIKEVDVRRMERVLERGEQRRLWAGLCCESRSVNQTDGQS